MLTLFVTFAAELAPATSAVDTRDVISLLSGFTALLAIAITSLRKRKDVSVDEMLRRIRSLEADNAEQDAALDRKDEALAAARAGTVSALAALYLTRQELSNRGIPDPSIPPLPKVGDGP